MKRKIIIEIDEGVTDFAALDAVTKVIKAGKISKEQGREVYCHFTVYHDYMVDINVSRRPYTREGLSKFNVWDSARSDDPSAEGVYTEPKEDQHAHN